MGSYWADVADGRMSAFLFVPQGDFLRGVEPFNAVKDISAQFISSGIAFPAKPFCLQGGEETFHSGVVPTVSAPAHAVYDAVRFEQSLEIFAGIGRIQSVVATLDCWTDCKHLFKTSAGVTQPSVFRGLLFNVLATAWISCALHRERSVPFGRYCLRWPFVFSFVPRCHGLRGSAK